MTRITREISSKIKIHLKWELRYKSKSGKPVKSILQLQDAFFVLITVLMLAAPDLSAQSRFLFGKENMLNSRDDVKTFILNDTIAKKDTIKNENYEFQMTRSPWKAVLYSAVIPGAGQFYNQSYWKIPVIWGVGGYFIYEAIRNNNSYIDYRELYEGSISEINPNGDQRYKTLREFYRDQRDQFYVYAGLVYFINLFDAYVDAHLFDFDVSDKIRIAGFKNPEKILNIKYNL